MIRALKVLLVSVVVWQTVALAILVISRVLAIMLGLSECVDWIYSVGQWLLVGWTASAMALVATNIPGAVQKAVVRKEAKASRGRAQ